MSKASEVIILVKSEGASAKLASVGADDKSWLNDSGYVDPAADKFTKVTIPADKFKTYMGINIVQYIRSMRIFYAKSLLQSSDMSIAEVAEMVGIKSASHFSKIFENEVGESLSKFRKSYFDRNHS